MHPSKIFFLLLLVVFDLTWPRAAFAQHNTTSFQHLTIENGLSDNRINCMVQDADGFMWICTEDGLNRFNGYTSKIFRHTEDSFSVCSNTITCAFKDRTNCLWFGGNGVMVCNPHEEKFVAYRHTNQSRNGLTNNDITAITQDENGAMWIGTRQGLFLFDERSKKFTPFLHDTTGSVEEVYRKNRIIRMVPDMHGNLWMSAIIGLYKFSLSTHAFTVYLYDEKNKGIFFGNHITALSFDGKGKLWMSVLDSTICTFDTLRKQFSLVQFPDHDFEVAARSVEDICTDAEGKTWIATSYNGLLLFNPDENRWQRFSHDIFDPKSLCDNKTLSLLCDKSGMTWIGTVSRGLERLSSHPDKFISYVLQPGKPGSLCENDITSASEDGKGNLWIGSKSGLMYFDRSKGAFSCFYHDDRNSNSLSHNLIYAVAEDADERLWIASENGLSCFNKKSGNWQHYFHEEKNNRSLPGLSVFEVLVRSNGEVWAGTSSGFCRFNAANATFENEYNNESIKKFTREYYTTLFEDSRHTVWLSTSRSGIFNADGNFNILHSYYHSVGFNANTVHQFAETRDGNILMATNAGLFMWNFKTALVSGFKSDNENLKGDLKTVLIENDSIAWSSTAHGLFRIGFNNENEIVSVKNFTSADGLQSDAFNNDAALRLKSGELFFGGINGFNLFIPAAIVYNTTLPPVRISSFKIFNLEHAFPAPGANGELTLNYDQNYFSFEMAALNYDHPEKNQFAYQLEGFDRNLNYSGTVNVASYTNVPPGSYVLHVMASNNDGLWNGEGAVLHLIIVPPFWKATWFRIVAILVLCLMAYFIYYLRVQKIKREEEGRSSINRQIAEARLIALSAQMNPHFIFNSLNSIQQFISESQKENALKYLSKFSKLIRLVLQNAGKNTTSVSNELNMLEFYVELEALRFSNKFVYQFDIDPGINRENTEIPTMLLQPYVENAIIHGLLNKPAPGHLGIKITKKDSNIFCVIQDDGIGRAAAASIKSKKLMRNESLGMKMTEERMQMLGHMTNKKVKINVVDLKNEHGSEAGTKVEIEISIEEE